MARSRNRARCRFNVGMVSKRRFRVPRFHDLVIAALRSDSSLLNGSKSGRRSRRHCADAKDGSRACPTSARSLRKSGRPDLPGSWHYASRVNPTCAVDRQQTITAPSWELYRQPGKSPRGECYPSLPRVEELLKAPRVTLLQQAGCPAFARHNGQPAIFPLAYPRPTLLFVAQSCGEPVPTSPNCAQYRRRRRTVIGRIPSVPNPKFAFARSTFGSELRIQRDTRNL
jgi:hypothetical protein